MKGKRYYQRDYKIRVTHGSHRTEHTSYDDPADKINEFLQENCFREGYERGRHKYLWYEPHNGLFKIHSSTRKSEKENCYVREILIESMSVRVNEPSELEEALIEGNFIRVT